MRMEGRRRVCDTPTCCIVLYLGNEKKTRRKPYEQLIEPRAEFSLSLQSGATMVTTLSCSRCLDKQTYMSVERNLSGSAIGCQHGNYYLPFTSSWENKPL
jgi:hypothetical protein